MKINIRKSDCKFYVNEEERTIVCVLHCNPHIVVDYADDFLDNYIWLSQRERETVQMPTVFIGKAVCAEGDEWNEELGRDLAFGRAKDKFYRSFFKRARKYIQLIDRHIDDLADSFNNFGQTVEDHMQGLYTKIEERMK